MIFILGFMTAVFLAQVTLYIGEAIDRHKKKKEEKEIKGEK